MPILTTEIVTSSSTGCQSSGRCKKSDGRLMGFLVFSIRYLLHSAIFGNLRYLALAGIHARCLWEVIVLYARFSLRIAERRTVHRMRKCVRLSVYSQCSTNHLAGSPEPIETECIAHLAASTSSSPPHPTRQVSNISACSTLPQHRDTFGSSFITGHGSTVVGRSDQVPQEI